MRSTRSAYKPARVLRPRCNVTAVTGKGLDRMTEKKEYTCEHCGRKFKTNNTLGARYCSDACRQAAYRERRQKQKQDKQEPGKLSPA
jgi:transposase-like protein